MKDSTKTGVGVVCALCFVVGLMTFLAETRSTGEALQNFNFTVSSSPMSIVGIILAVTSLAILVVLYLPEMRKALKQKRLKESK